MIRLKLSIDLWYEISCQSGDFIFNIHAADTSQQKTVGERLYINPPQTLTLYSDPICGNRFMRFTAAPGILTIRYVAVVDIDHHVATPDSIAEAPIAEIPPAVLPYIYPSRYCQSDQLRRLATAEFGHLPQGYRRVQAIQEWVRQHTTFKSGSSNDNTSAVDTLIEKVGVCRDFAHVMIALCRAINIPARFVTGIDYGADPALGPTDFHAYVEVFLKNRWYLFDPTGVSPPMGLLRIGTGRDAADASFATMFGAIISRAPRIQIEAVDDITHGFHLPSYSNQALSSMAEPRI